MVWPEHLPGVLEQGTRDTDRPGTWEASCLHSNVRREIGHTEARTSGHTKVRPKRARSQRSPLWDDPDAWREWYR